MGAIFSAVGTRTRMHACTFICNSTSRPPPPPRPNPPIRPGGQCPPGHPLSAVVAHAGARAPAEGRGGGLPARGPGGTGVRGNPVGRHARLSRAAGRGAPGHGGTAAGCRPVPGGPLLPPSSLSPSSLLPTPLSFSFPSLPPSLLIEGYASRVCHMLLVPPPSCRWCCCTLRVESGRRRRPSGQTGLARLST